MVKPHLLIAVFALLLAPAAAEAAQAQIQAEDFSASNDIAFYPIRSNLGFLEGLDSNGEWTQYVLPALPFGTYQVHIRCWGNEVPYLLHLVTFPAGDEEQQTIDFSFTGKGTSVCG